jgi:Fe2+ or Zn2+ uptake regulation protein
MVDSQPDPRLPSNYNVILEVVRSQGTGQHATTSDIFAEAKRRKPRIGYSTVYRALNRLRDLGLVLEVRIPGAASALYEPMGTSHAHFLCKGCGRVDDIDYIPSKAVFAELSLGQDMEISDLSVTAHGLCAACRDAAVKPRQA